MTDEQIKYMVDRFLGWRLPENFNPDGGISFEPIGNTGRPEWSYKREPTGTNLLDAVQAGEMIRYLIEGMPQPPPHDLVAELEKQKIVADDFYCRYLQQMKTMPCLGEDKKIASGEFDKENLEAHRQAAQLYGEYIGRDRLVKHLRRFLKEVKREPASSY
jgi:hypothetical protein